MSALILTSKTYLEALRDIVITRLPSGMVIDDLVIHTPRKMRSGEVRVRISIKPESYEKPGWSWYGATELKHQQIALDDLFQGCIVTFDPDLLGDVFTTDDIVNQLFDRFQIHFDPQEYFSGEYVKSATTEVLLEITNSYRYKGNISIVSITSVDLLLRTREGDPIATREGQPITIL